MNYRTLAALLLFSNILLPAAGYGQIVPGSGDWRTHKTQHFLIHYQRAHQAMAVRVGTLAERVHAKLEPKYKSGANETHIVIVMDSDLVNAFATPYGMDRIFLFLDSPAPGEFSRFDLWVDMLVTHEYTHILTLRPYNTALGITMRIVFGLPPNLLGPPGMSEGYAVYEESQKGLGRLHDPLTKMIFRTAVLEDKFPNAGEIMMGSHRWPHGQLYYLYGGGLVDFMHREFPEGAGRFWTVDTPPLMLDSKLGGARMRSYGYLYREFKKEKFDLMNAEIQRLKELGITQFDRLTVDGEYKEHLTPGTTGLLYFARPAARPPGYYRYVSPDEKPAYLKRVLSSAGISEAADVAVSSEDYYFLPGYGIRQELYDTRRTRFLRRLMPGVSVMDPALSPDGKTLYYIEKNTTVRTVKRVTYADGVEGSASTIYSVPFTGILRFTAVSPDQRYLTFVARKGETGRGGLVLCDLSQAQENACRTIAAGQGSIVRPRFSPDSKTIYFSSDADGIYNVYSIQVETGLVQQRTRTLTGLFDPVPEGDSLYALGYFANGFDIVRMRNADLLAQNSDLFKPRAEETNSFFEEENPIPAGEKPAAVESPIATAEDPSYSGILSIRPYFLGLFGPVAAFNLGLGAVDPLGRHELVAAVAPGSPDPHAVALYDYSRFIINLSLFYSTNYWKRDRAPGCLLPDDPTRFICDDKYSFTEEGAGYFRFTSQGRFFSYQVLPGYVTYKLRNARRIRITEYDARDLNLSGPSLILIAGGTDYYSESISPENGWRLILQSEYFTKDTSKRELDPRARTPIEYGQAEGGLALYLPSLWDHHVNYLSAYGYSTYGPDREIQNVRLSRFQRGIAYSRSPVGPAAALFTYEYRLPLVWLSRPVGGSPEFNVRGLGMGVFAETGTSFNRVMYRDQFQSSVGVSFLLNVNVLYLPLAPIRFSVSHGLGKAGETQFAIIWSTGFGSQIDGRNSDAVTRPWHRSMPHAREQAGYFRNPEAGGVLE